jgi:hypothetical protein
VSSAIPLGWPVGESAWPLALSTFWRTEARRRLADARHPEGRPDARQKTGPYRLVSVGKCLVRRPFGRPRAEQRPSPCDRASPPSTHGTTLSSPEGGKMDSFMWIAVPDRLTATGTVNFSEDRQCRCEKAREGVGTVTQQKTGPRRLPQATDTPSPNPEGGDR